MKNKFYSLLVLFISTILFYGCTTTSKLAPSIIQEDSENNMYWHITSPTGTTIHILGTIHVGDDEIANIPQNILTNFRTSDERFGELSFEDITNLQTTLSQLLLTSIITNENEVPIFISQLLTENEVDFLKTVVQNIFGDLYTDEFFTSLLIMPPWYFNTLLVSYDSNISGYQAEKGLDSILMSVASKEGLSIKGMDTLQCQLDILTFGSLEDQIILLKDYIKTIQNGTSVKQTQELINAYKTNDKSSIINILKSENEIAGLSKNYENEYMTKMINERNRNWANQISTLLQEQNKNFFIFAGSAHWLYTPSVFDMLVDDGIAIWK